MKKNQYLLSKKYLRQNDYHEDKTAKTESYFYKEKNLPVVNKKLINCLIFLFQILQKKSIRVNLHSNQKSKKHNMIILHRKSSEQKIHSHLKNGETVQMIKGKVKIEFFKKNLEIKENVILDDKNKIILSIPKKNFS